MSAVLAHTENTENTEKRRTEQALRNLKV